MKTLELEQLQDLQGGADSFSKDVGQFLGGVSGWMSSNSALYLVLGPGIGGLAAIAAGLSEAER